MVRRVRGSEVSVPLRRSLLPVATAALLGACFDAQQVQKQSTRLTWPLVQQIDDFETGHGYPTWSQFNQWGCTAYPEDVAVECNDATHFGFAYHAGVMDFALGREDYSGAILYVLAPDPLDLSSYDELVFTAGLEPRHEGSLPPHVELRVELACEGAAAVGTSPGGVPVMLGSAVNLAPGASQRYALDLHRLRQPPWQTEEFYLERIDPSECLRNVTALRFELTAEPHQTLAGRLILDDIDLYDFPDSDPPAPGLARLSPWAFCLMPEAGAEWDCADTERGSTMTFAVENQPGVDDSPAVWLCADVVQYNQTTHELEQASLDLLGHRLLRFDARFAGAGVSRQPHLRTEVDLHCTSLLPTGSPFLHREITVEAGRARYALPLETFEASPYPLGFNDELGCLRQVEKLCFGTSLEDGESAAGTLTVGDLAVE